MSKLIIHLGGGSSGQVSLDTVREVAETLYKDRVNGDKTLACASAVLNGPQEITFFAKLLVYGFPDFLEEIDNHLPTMQGLPKGITKISQLTREQRLERDEADILKDLRETVFTVFSKRPDYQSNPPTKVTAYC